MSVEKKKIIEKFAVSYDFEIQKIPFSFSTTIKIKIKIIKSETSAPIAKHG